MGERTLHQLPGDNKSLTRIIVLCVCLAIVLGIVAYYNDGLGLAESVTTGLFAIICGVIRILNRRETRNDG